MHTNCNLDYWKNEISKIEEKCDLNGLFKRKKSHFNNFEERKNKAFVIADKYYENLKRMADRNSVKIESILQFVWHKLLSVYGNTNYTVIGTVVSELGLLPCIVHHKEYNSILNIVKNIEGGFNGMNDRGIIHWSQLGEDTEKMQYSLFDSLFLYNMHPNVHEELNHLLIAVAYESIDTESLSFVIYYDSGLFEEDTINDLLDVTNQLLIQIGTQQVTHISHLQLLSIKQLKRINQWNNTDRAFPLNKQQTTLHQFFEEKVKKSPEKIAVVYEDLQLTYDQLNQKANQLAHYLKSLCDIHPDDVIGLLLDKNELMIISILGVWKSGAAYVPIDSSYPDERTQFILEDTKAKMIITNQKYVNQLCTYDTIKVDIDSIFETIDIDKNNENPDSIVSDNNLAYVTYTSGTTGKPKGVMKEHQSVINVVIDLTEKYNLIASDGYSEKIVLFSEYVYEPCIRQFLMTLLNSHTLVIAKQVDIHNPNRFSQFLNKNQISYLNGTASLLNSYDYSNVQSLKRLIFAGEELTANCFHKLRTTFKGTIINEYGPTEVALVSTMKKFDLNEERINRSIGRPLMNVKCYVLDQHLNQLPIGAIGELYIGGIGVARGYLNRSELTAERFLPNPFQTEEEKKQGKNARMYKTGDLVRWLPNGEIEYLGRNDFQVKIRGLRIELGEIETVLSSFQGITRSVILAKDHKNKDADTSSNKYLIAYYVSDNDIGESDLKQFMQSKLPNYMIPNRLIRIEKIPLTINGKLDVRSLPEVDFSVDEKNYVGPRNDLERKLCQLWSDLLGIEHIGIRDDFFRLGGDSIGALQIVSRLRQNHGLNICINDIFTCKTIEALYDNQIQVQLVQSATETPSFDEEKLILLWSIQEYFLRQNRYQRVSFELAEFDENKLKHCLMKLIKHHAALRNYFQYYETNFRIENAESIEKVLLIKDLDIENEPMYVVYHSNDESTKVWLFINYLIIDWTSLCLICDELQRLYTDNDISTSNDHYQQWLEAVKNDVNDIETGEKIYWQSILDSKTLADKQQIDDAFSEMEIVLTDEMSKDLFIHCNKIYNTKLEHLLLTALGYTLHDEITHLKENCIMFEECARDFVNNCDMQQSIGMFRTIYPIRLQLPDNNNDIAKSIINVKEHLKQVPNKGLGFSTVIGCIKNVLPRISFNYLGQLTKQFKIISENIEESIQINAFIINEQIRLNIKTKFGFERTTQFTKTFQFHIENIAQHTRSMHRTYLTRSDVNYIVKNDHHLNQIQSNKEIDAIFLANSLQQGLLYHSLKQSNIDDAYIVQSVFEYRKNIDQNLLKMAWKQAQTRFSCLRLRFDWQDELIQIIDRNQSLDWRFRDLSTDENLSIKQIEEEDRNERFQLDIGNLFRIYLIKQKHDLFVLIFSFHHIILDGWSLPILFDYVHQNYLSLIESKHSCLSPISIRDESYENAQLYLQIHRQDNLDYWENEINTIEERCDFNSLLKQENKNKIVLNQYDHMKEPKTRRLIIANELYTNLRNLCREYGLTMNSILQFVWHRILSVYGNSNQTIIGTTVSGRSLPVDDIENSVGLFINTLPLIVNHNLDKSIIDAIKNIQSKMNSMISQSNVDLSELSKGKMKHSLFDSLFIYENYPNLKNKIEQRQKLLQFQKKYDIEKLDYPLAVVVYENNENQSLIFTINYAGELFEQDTIDDLLDITKQLLFQIGIQHVTQIAGLQVLPIKQSNRINQWNDTDREFTELNRKITLHRLFEEEADKSPENIAVVYEDTQLTYKQLNQKANQLAHYLRSLCDIHPDDLVALLLDKSELMIISILGVWKSGAAYVPIDPSYPDERIQFILEDTKAKMIITNQKYTSRLDSYEMIKIDIDSIFETIDTEKNRENPEPISFSDDLAYVIYTSGTTGKPKGVMIEHTGVNNLKIALTELFQLKSKPEAVLSFSNYVFDHFVEQMTYALLNSQVLVILNDEMRVDKPRLYHYLNKNKVTYLSGTPSVLQEYDYEQLNHIVRIDAVGEDFSEIIFNKIRSKFNGLIINGYGPTEISITSHKKLYYLHENRSNKSIGRQIANTSCYVLDQHLNQLPIGAIGELFIGGIGVARGYLNRPELTAERFLPNPFQTEEEKKQGKNARMYKTGDLVRWLPNGEIEYLGRNDFQVKIRGLRIELGEIETVLSSYPGIKQSVVIAKNAEDRRQKYLLGYFVSENNLLESEIKQYMQTKLPDYMIPNRLIRIAKIPVNISGKLDSRALPEIDFTQYNQNERVPPRNDLETKIAQIWSQLLCIPIGNLSVHDDFFSLGGDSILVIKLSLMITNSLSIKLTVPAIFVNKTIAKLALHILRGVHHISEKDEQIIKISNNDLTHPYYPLSFAQERLLFINEFNGENDAHAYNIPFYFQFSNENVQRDLLYQSLRSVLSRHEILRTLLRDDKFGMMSQYVLNESEVNSLFQIDTIQVHNEEQLNTEFIQLTKYIFNLRNELPVKIKFYENECESTMFYMGIVFHHICFDGWSWTIFQRDLQMFYDYFGKKTLSKVNLPELKIQYKDFAVWQKNYLTDKRLNNLLKFWKNQLNDFETLNLIVDCPIRPSNYDYTGSDIQFHLDQSTTFALKQLAMNLNVTLFSLLLSAYTLMLSNCTNQHDIIIGTPVANRNQSELENLIGFFVNILVLRMKIDAQDSVMDFIKKISNEVINAQIHQEMPFERLVKELQIENDPSRHPIIQVMFIMNNQIDTSKSFQISEYASNDINTKIAKYDLSVAIDETDICLRGHFNFATKLFNESTIYHMIQSFLHILTRFTELNQTCQVRDIDCINSIQYNQINTWNTPNKNHLLTLNKQTTLYKLFEEQVEKSPEKMAVVYGDIQLTYTELNQKANQLAHHLRSLCDICPDDLVALLLDKSELMIISILGVWKSGAAYVPIDPSYPDERIQFILEDTKAKMIITNQKYTSRLDSYEMIKIDIDSIFETIDTEKNRENPEPISFSDDLAYVIYTSGTTGKPKGVLIKHQGVVSFRNDIVSRYFDANIQSEAILFFSNYVFDFSIEQFALSILNSQTLIIPAIGFTVDDQFYSYLNQSRLTYLSGTPTQLQQINLKALKHLKTLTIAGEALTEKLFEKIRQEYKGKIINAYGVTETTVYNMVYIYENDMKYKNSIGTLLSNTKRFVLNKNMQMLPACAIGELYLTGDCMSRGYLNRPELNSERFLPNPFQTEEEKKQGKNAYIYKTGDLVRWLPDGQLEYLGRNDFQVKIRGLRIELGEIETVLSSFQGITRSVILAKDHKNKDADTSSNKYLIAYYVSDNDIDESDLKQFMQSKLPNYMIPNRLIRIEKIPVTINGKLDARSLPEVDFSVDEKNYVGPRNDLERKLCQLWSDLLGIEHIGIRDDFFRLGGDSISSLQLIGRIRKDLNLSISVKDIFVYKRIENLCENVLINSFQVNEYEEDTLDGEVPLLPIQEWFFSKYSTSMNHWNQAFLIETPHLDLHKLKDSLIKLIDHHDAFKLRFHRINENEYTQYYDNSSNHGNMFTLKYLDVRSLDQNTNQNELLNKILTDWQSHFDIEHGPLFAVGYLTGFSDDKARIWFAMHHLIIDVVSWRILCENLHRLYNGSSNLGRKGSSYRQWSQLVQSYGQRHSATEGIYWRNLLVNVPHFNRNLMFGHQWITTTISISLDAMQTSSLLRDCPHVYNVQINVLLLTALGYALKEITENRINYVTLEGHGREDIGDNTLDISRTVGWFTTMYPVLLEIDDDLNRSIINVKECLMNIPNKGIGYGTIIGYKDRELPRVSFNYLGQFEGSNNNGWHLTDGIVGNEYGHDQATIPDDHDMIAVNGFCMKGQLRFNIKSRLDSERTANFVDKYKSKLEDIISQCSAKNLPNTLDYSNNFEHPYVIFNENSENILFILPPGEGGAESYFNNIVPHLSSYQLVIFNNYYLDLKAKSMEKGFSFEILAPLYIKYIKQIQPHGPYNFLGWSFGGVLSFEIARQLNNTGDQIDNIFMIDSYFNVIKATIEIGKSNKMDIIDQINYFYLPKIDKEPFESNIINRNINIVLFKANMIKEKYQSKDELELFTYYSKTTFNNLDTLINQQFIKLFQMENDSHFSWVFNKTQIIKMCNSLINSLK